MIGIMADSHGQPESIVAALRLLSERDCRLFYHLGDVCDSTHPETVEACLRPLRDHCARIIKGNNDHAIVANHFGRERPPVSQETLQYLKNLPLVQHHLNALFVHSLPFTRELGLSSMIGQLGCSGNAPFFKEFPDHIMFRGHSHSPELFWSQKQGFAGRSLAAGEKI